MSLAGDTVGAKLAWSNFKKLRDSINNRKKFEERNFKAQKVGQNLDSPANIWRTAKGFMDWESSGGPPSQLNVDNNLITKAGSIATKMNEFVIQKVTKIRNSIPFLTNTFEKCKSMMEDKSCKLALSHVTIKKVNELLKSLKNTRSTSIDELDNFCIKISADIIDKPLHHVVTLSVQQQKFPTGWKYSKVIPLHKKGCKLDRQNYRPVAILSPLSKILEKIIYEQLYGYFTRNKIFHNNLHGYREHRSTQTALMTMYDRWVKAAASSQVSGVVLLDLSAAFDLADPLLLIEKLRIYGIQEDLVSWIQSYLTDRHQAVWLDHALSEFLHTEVGVPQGSNLGPLFFLIFFNDLPDSLDNDVDSYADDTSITATANTVDEISKSLTKDCEKVSGWMRANKLKLNAGKTHIMTVGTRERLVTLPDTVQVTMDNVLLVEDPEKTELLLGCHIQSNLKWQKQISTLLGKLRIRLAGLLKLKFIVPYSMLKTISDGLFNSVLVYCLPLYGGMDVGDQKDLQVMQNKVAQIVTRSPPRAARAPLYNKLGWLTVNQLVFNHSVLAVYKLRTNREPEYLASLLTRDNRNSRIIIPNITMRLAQDSFSMRGAESWNSIPLAIRRNVKIGSFKTQVKKWINENVQQFLE